MKPRTGLWIDHSKAILVSVDGDTVSTRTIESEVGKRVRAKGGARSGGTPYGPQDATYEARRDRKYEHHLAQYYDQVASAIRGTGAVLIMGPGQAKSELKSKLVETGIGETHIEMEASDKLTEPQIVEKVKNHYGLPTRES